MAPSDYEEFLESLNANGVRYLIVGAHAVAHHARPRATKDLDIFHDGSPDAARRILTAIKEFFGGADLGFSVDDLTDPNVIVQLGVAPVRIDLLSSLSGVPDFEEAWNRRADAKYAHVETQYLSLDDLIRSKEAAGRAQDKADLRSLKKAKLRKK
ncbi:MAG: nucleotidyltransferase [Planctomycetota bacterium]